MWPNAPRWKPSHRWAAARTSGLLLPASKDRSTSLVSLLVLQDLLQTAAGDGHAEAGGAAGDDGAVLGGRLVQRGGLQGLVVGGSGS